MQLLTLQLSTSHNASIGLPNSVICLYLDVLSAWKVTCINLTFPVPFARTAFTKLKVRQSVYDFAAPAFACMPTLQGVV